MKSLFVLFFGSIFLYSSAIAQPINEEVSSGTIFDGEPYLVINPTNSDNMIIGWMSTAKGTLAIRVRTTFDGGITWGNEVVMPHSNPTFQSADVSMTFGKNGVVYLEYIDYTRSPHDSGLIVVTHSGDGGKSWDKPIEAFNYYDNTIAPIDRPWMVVDNSGTASDGTIYITTKPVPWNTLPSHPYLKYSTDNGKTWSKIDSVDGGEYPAGIVAAPMVSPAVSSDGVFHAAYASWDVKKNPLPRYTLANSTDKGVSYTRTTIYSPTTGAKGDTLSKVGYRLAANPLNPKNLVFVSLDSRNGDYDVYAFVTTDNGATWSKGERINDDAIGNGIWQDLLWANFSDNGKCVISWRDRRNGDSTGYEQGSDIYFAVSTDNGKSFGKNIRLSDKTAPFANDFNERISR